MLIIEDGTGVSNANSYASVAECRAYAGLRGLAMPADDSAVEVLLVKGADYLETFESKYKGTKTQAAYALAWPRALVFMFNAHTPLPETTIPSQLKAAQCQLASDQYGTDGTDGISLQPAGTGQQVISEKVDVLETHYSDTHSSSVLPVLNKALGILAPLFNISGNFALSARRI